MNKNHDIIFIYFYFFINESVKSMFATIVFLRCWTSLLTVVHSCMTLVSVLQVWLWCMQNPFVFFINDIYIDHMTSTFSSEWMKAEDHKAWWDMCILVCVWVCESGGVNNKTPLQWHHDPSWLLIAPLFITITPWQMGIHAHTHTNVKSAKANVHHLPHT